MTESAEQFLTQSCAIDRFVVPYKATANHPLTEDQETVNKAYSQRRMPAEHIMALIKSHAILNGNFRGSFAMIQAAFKMIVHTTAYMLRNTERGARIRIHSLRPEPEWHPLAPWDSDGED